MATSKDWTSKPSVEVKAAAEAGDPEAQTVLGFRYGVLNMPRSWLNPDAEMVLRYERRYFGIR